MIKKYLALQKNYSDKFLWVIYREQVYQFNNSVLQNSTLTKNDYEGINRHWLLDTYSTYCRLILWTREVVPSTSYTFQMHVSNRYIRMYTHLIGKKLN